MTTKQKTFEVKATDEGLHLQNTILWFDSPSCPDMSFLSSATPPLPLENPGRKTRWIATDDTVALAKAMGRDYNALRCQYHRPFSVGSLRLEMIPSGGGLGCSSLYVEHKGKSLLYAPMLQSNRSPLSRQIELRRAETLILCAHDPLSDSTPPHRDKVLLDIVQHIQKHIQNDFWPTIFCAPSPMAQNLTRSLTDHGIPVVVPPAIAKIHKLYTNCGVALGNYATLSNKRNKLRPGVHIQPLRLPRSHAYNPSTIQVQNQSGDVQEFHYPLWAQINDLQTVIEQVKPAQTFILGPYARSYAASLKSTHKISPLFKNNEPTLF